MALYEDELLDDPDLESVFKSTDHKIKKAEYYRQLTTSALFPPTDEVGAEVNEELSKWAKSRVLGLLNVERPATKTSLFTDEEVAVLKKLAELSDAEIQALKSLSGVVRSSGLSVPQRKAPELAPIQAPVSQTKRNFKLKEEVTLPVPAVQAPDPKKRVKKPAALPQAAPYDPQSNFAQMQSLAMQAHGSNRQLYDRGLKGGAPVFEERSSNGQGVSLNMQNEIDEALNS